MQSSNSPDIFRPLDQYPSVTCVECLVHGAFITSNLHVYEVRGDFYTFMFSLIRQ